MVRFSRWFLDRNYSEVLRFFSDCKVYLELTSHMNRRCALLIKQKMKFVFHETKEAIPNRLFWEHLSCLFAISFSMQKLYQIYQNSIPSSFPEVFLLMDLDKAVSSLNCTILSFLFLSSSVMEFMFDVLSLDLSLMVLLLSLLGSLTRNVFLRKSLSLRLLGSIFIRWVLDGVASAEIAFCCWDCRESEIKSVLLILRIESETSMIKKIVNKVKHNWVQGVPLQNGLYKVSGHPVLYNLKKLSIPLC